MPEEMHKLTPQHAYMRRRGQHMTAKERKQAQDIFLDVLGKTANIRAACQKAGISRSIVYEWKEHSTEFGILFQEANEEANDLIRAALWRRGVEGVETYVVSMGKQIFESVPQYNKDGSPQLDNKGKHIVKLGKPLMQREYSDSLLSLLAKARMPEFREKQQLDVTTTTSAKDMQSLHDAVAQALAEYPEARIAVAQALAEKGKPS